MNRLTSLPLAIATSLLASTALANHQAVEPPLPTGSFAVACTNVAQDPALIAQQGGTAEDYWEGQDSRYLTTVLAAPSTAMQFGVLVPDDGLYPKYRGQAVAHVAIVCHPTPSANADPAYVLPGTGDVVPHMQPAGAPPKLVPNGRFPLIVFAHGLGGSPISPGYIDALVELASHGFVVAGAFHGDARITRIRLEDIDDLVFLLTRFDEFAEMELIRPLATTALIDRVLGDPGLAAAIDATRIGGFGTSMGGQSLANSMGAKLTTSLSKACRETAQDPRIAAAVGLVPYMGQTFLPSFCDDQSGVESLRRPYLAIAGTADTTAPIGMVRQAVNRFGGSRFLVEMEGVEHEYRPEFRPDVFTWTVTFLNAYLGVERDPGAMGRFIRMGEVQGGITESLTIDRHVPLASTQGEVPVVEFYHPGLDHYFITANPAEAEWVRAGGAGEWEETGGSFKGWFGQPGAATGAVPVCRFYGAYAGGPNSHFYTANPAECAWLQEVGGWYYEGTGFHVLPTDAANHCPFGMLEVLRAYNNGFVRNDSNHRFTTSRSEWRDMERHGWMLEVGVMCSRP